MIDYDWGWVCVCFWDLYRLTGVVVSEAEIGGDLVGGSA